MEVSGEVAQFVINTVIKNRELTNHRLDKL